MRRYALPFLIVLNGLFAAALVGLWFTPSGHLRNVSWAPPEPQRTDLASMLPQLPGGGGADTSRFVAMLDRPLFSPTRRPPPPPPPVKADVPEPVDRLNQAKLTGIFEGRGIGGIIVNLDGKDRRVPLNGDFEGWTLQSVMGGQAVFARSGQTRQIPLTRAGLTAYTGMPIQVSAPAALPYRSPPSPPSSSASSGTAASSGAEAKPARSSGPSFGVSR